MMRALLVAGLLAASPAAADDSPADAAEAASVALAAAAERLADAKGARDRVRALTETVRAYETGLSALREGLRQAIREESRLEAEFAEAEDRLSNLLGALLTMQSAPEAASLLHPAGPTDTARAGMILSDVTPALETRAAALRADLEEMAALRTLQESAQATLLRGLAGVQDARAALSNAIAERDAAGKASPTDLATMQALVTGADTLQGFAASLATIEVERPNTTQPFAGRKGALPLPAPGRVLTRFNETDASGRKRPGLTLAVSSEALITAPHDGTLRYAGPLLDLGNVSILEPEPGTLLVFAGLGTVYGQQGDVVAAGAPLGLAGASSAAADRILIDLGNPTGQDRPETLYIELRLDQEPQDPAAWFDLAEREG